MPLPSDTGALPSGDGADPARHPDGDGSPENRTGPRCAPSVKQNGPRTVAAGFAEFSERLVPKYAEPEAAESTLSAIERCLAASFGMSYLAPYGSRGHGTHVAGFSAVDSFAVMQKSRLLEASGKSLAEVHNALIRIFPDAFVTEGRPVVAVPFGPRHSQRHHIVPAFESGTKDGHDLFAVPAPRDRWINICPAAHSIWINELDDTLKRNLKPFIRFVKAWSYYNGGVIWPYYLELCAADYLKNDSGVVHSHDLCNFFAYMRTRALAPFEEAAGCDEPVYGTSIADRDSAMVRVRAAADMAAKARECEQRDNVADAFYWWRKVFDWRFAAY